MRMLLHLSIVLLVSSPAFAQWANVPVAALPRTADGKPNLSAETPRLSDGKPDLFLLGAVVENSKVRDLLLRNEGDGKFRDVTKEMGLAESWPSLGCCVGDFNNDGYPDLLITGVGQQKLFTNVADSKGKRQFKDETKAAGITPLSAESEYLPLTPVELPEEQATEVLKLVDRLEQDDDVQKVFHALA